MSDGTYAKMAEAWDKTKAWDPITPNLIQKVFEQDSRNMKKLGNATGWDQLEQDAQWNLDNPEEGIAKASVATGLGFLTAGLGGPAAGAGEAAAATTAEQAAQVAAQKAAEEAAKQAVLESAQYAGQQGLLESGAGLLPQGFGNTMEAGLTDAGYTPSSLWNAATRGPGSGQSMGDTLGNFASNRGRGLLQKFQNAPGNFVNKFQQPGTYKKAALKMGAGLLDQPQQQPMSRPMMPQQQEQQPSQPFYGGQGGMYQGGLLGMSEEEKRRLRMMGYQV